MPQVDPTTGKEIPTNTPDPTAKGGGASECHDEIVLDANGVPQLDPMTGAPLVKHVCPHGKTTVIPLGGGPGSPGSTGGSSSGGSTGGGTVDPLIGRGEALYAQLWGETAPPGLVARMVHQGLNIWQMEDRWRHDPAFLKTKTAKTEADSWASILHSIGAA